MKKSIITLATVSVVGLGSVFLPQVTHADTLDQLKNKQSQIQDERGQLKANLSKAEAQIADLLIDLEKLNNEIERTEKALEENKKQMKKAKKSIAKTEKEVEELEKAIEERVNILKERAVSYQVSGGNIGFLDVIFGSQDFADFIGRISAVTKITESDNKLIDQIEEDKQKFEKKLNKLEEQKAELEGIQTLILEQKEGNELRKQELKNKEQELQEKAEKLKIKDSNLASLESQVRNNIAALTQPVQTVNVTSQSNEVASTSTSKTTSAPKSNPAPSANGGSAISAGYSVMGTPYLWTGSTPGGFDCSGFVQWAYGQAGKTLPRTTYEMVGVGTKVSYSNAQPGDLVFFDTAGSGSNSHVGIYLGGGKFIGAQNSTGVAVADMNSGYWKQHFNGIVKRVN